MALCATRQASSPSMRGSNMLRDERKTALSQGYRPDQRRGKSSKNESFRPMVRRSSGAQSTDSNGHPRMGAQELRTERPMQERSYQQRQLMKEERRARTSPDVGTPFVHGRKTERVKAVPSLHHKKPAQEWPTEPRRRQLEMGYERRGHEDLLKNAATRRLMNDQHERQIIRRQNGTKPEYRDFGFKKYHDRSRGDSFDSVSSFTETNRVQRRPYQYRYEESVTTDSMISFDERRQQRMDTHQRQQSYDEDIERGLRRFGFKPIDRNYDEETEESFGVRSQFTAPSYCNESIRSFDSRGRTDLRTYDVDSVRSFDSGTQRQFEDNGRASTYCDDESYPYSVQDSYNPRAFNTRYDTMSRRSVETQTELSELESTRGGFRRRLSDEEDRNDRPTYDGRNDRYRDDKDYFTHGTKLRDENSEISRDELSEVRSHYDGGYPETNSRISVEDDGRSFYTAPSRDDRSEVSWRRPYDRSLVSESDYRRPVSVTESDLTERAPRFNTRSRESERELPDKTRGRNTKRDHSFPERGNRDDTERQNETWRKPARTRTRDWESRTNTESEFSTSTYRRPQRDGRGKSRMRSSSLDRLRDDLFLSETDIWDEENDLGVPPSLHYDNTIDNASSIRGRVRSRSRRSHKKGRHEERHRRSQSAGDVVSPLTQENIMQFSKQLDPEEAAKNAKRLKMGELPESFTMTIPEWIADKDRKPVYRRHFPENLKTDRRNDALLGRRGACNENDGRSPSIASSMIYRNGNRDGHASRNAPAYSAAAPVQDSQAASINLPEDSFSFGPKYRSRANQGSMNDDRVRAKGNAGARMDNSPDPVSRYKAEEERIKQKIKSLQDGDIGSVHSIKSKRENRKNFGVGQASRRNSGLSPNRGMHARRRDPGADAELALRVIDTVEANRKALRNSSRARGAAPLLLRDLSVFKNNDNFVLCRRKIHQLKQVLGAELIKENKEYARCWRCDNCELEIEGPNFEVNPYHCPCGDDLCPACYRVFLARGTNSVKKVDVEASKKKKVLNWNPRIRRNST